MKRALIPFILFVIIVAAPPQSFACTTFCFVDQGQVIFGKNYDWNLDDGLVLVNKRGVSRSSFAPAGQDNPARWSSRYGSVTFNQYGRDFPSGGMNEKGLIVELMWLEETVYPADDQRPSVGVLEWIQYQMDMSATVADVIGSDKAIRIAGRSPLHYLVADRSGAVAVVEFLEGRMKTHTGASLPIAALTNDTYEESLAFAKSIRDVGRPEPAGPQSLHRFARTARRVADYRKMPAERAVAEAFSTLESAASETTQWRIVYDPIGRRVHFRTRLQPAVRTLAIDKLDFSCESAVLIADMNGRTVGDLAPVLRPWSVEANLDLVRRAYAKTTFLAGVPESDIQKVGRSPLNTTCGGPQGSGGAR